MRSALVKLCLLIGAIFPIEQLVAEDDLATDYDVLKLPAVESHLASKSLIYSLYRHDQRIFASGHRGHILYSDDNGDSWTQAKVPVRSGILNVHFVNDSLGWAVGHGGIILHSNDGGENWHKQYDGHRLGNEGLPFYQQLAAENPDNKFYQSLIGEMEYALQQGADKPLFNIFFINEKWGYAAGAYGILLRTLDGGESWRLAMHTVENEDFYHLFDSVPMQNQKRLIAGEAGLIFAAITGTVDENSEFVEGSIKLLDNSPYDGSFFTCVAADNGNVVIAGLRGQTFVSQDFGVSWSAVSKPATGSVNDSSKLSDGRIVLVTMTGNVLISNDNGLSFSDAGRSPIGPLFAVAQAGANALVLGGPDGIHKIFLEPKPSAN